MQGHASLSSHIRAAGLAGALLTGPTPAEGAASPAIRVSGEVLVVGVEDGTLLLDGERGLEFLVVHPDAEVRDFRSETMLALAQIRPGDLVEYTTEVTTGMPLVSRLVVTPLGTRLFVTTPLGMWAGSGAPRAPPDRRRGSVDVRTWLDRSGLTRPGVEQGPP